MTAELISGVPNEVTVGAIGVLGIVIGAVLTAALNSRTVKQQLAHDCEQRERERVFALRRDVFLEYADAATKPLLYLGQISNANVSMDQLNTIQQSTMGPASKLHGVANLSTIKALVQAQEHFASVTLLLLKKRVEMEKLTAKMKIIDIQIENARRQASEFTDSIHSLTRLAMPPDPARMNDLVRLLSAANKHEAELTEQHTKLIFERSELQIVMASEAAQAMGDYYRHIARLNVAMRNEMDMPLQDEYEKLVMESFERIRLQQLEFTKHLLSDLEKHRETIRKPGPAPQKRS